MNLTKKISIIILSKYTFFNRCDVFSVVIGMIEDVKNVMKLKSVIDLCIRRY
jgi:hypothetical protein